jgi:hypothetical protein
MVFEIQTANPLERNPAAVVCICSLAGHFLLEQLMSGKVKAVLVEAFKKNIHAYFATAQRALKRISPLAPPSLSQIQALILGVSKMTTFESTKSFVFDI